MYEIWAMLHNNLPGDAVGILEEHGVELEDVEWIVGGGFEGDDYAILLVKLQTQEWYIVEGGVLRPTLISEKFSTLTEASDAFLKAVVGDDVL